MEARTKVLLTYLMTFLNLSPILDLLDLSLALLNLLNLSVIFGLSKVD